MPEARELLQWPELSAQVRARSPPRRSACARALALPLGATPEEKARLLAETSVAATPARAAGSRARSSRARATSAPSSPAPPRADASRAGVPSRTSPPPSPPRAPPSFDTSPTTTPTTSPSPFGDWRRPLARIPTHLEPEIRRCVLIPGGNLLDDASPALASIRAERRETEKTLRALNEKAQFLARKNFAERAQVVTRLGRECVPKESRRAVGD